MKIGIFTIATKLSRIKMKELVVALQNSNYDVMLMSSIVYNPFPPDFEKHKIAYCSIPIHRDNTNVIKEIKSFIETYIIINSCEIDQLIIYGIRTFPTMVLAAKLAGIKKIICVVNGTGRLFLLGGVKGFLVKLVSFPMLWLALLSADFIFFQNPDDLALIKRNHLLWKQNYGRINGSGVNLEAYYVVPLAEKPVFTMICRVTGAKGVNEYIKAAHRVKTLFPETNFLLIGPMDDRDQSINQQAFHKAVQEGIVQYIGRVDDVRPYLAKSRVFVLPSYYREGVPRTNLEAMAMGRPILTTDWPGCRETVVEGVNGFLVPIRDADTLAEKMIWLIEHPDDAAKMGRESRRIAEEKFDVHKINEKIIQKLMS